MIHAQLKERIRSKMLVFAPLVVLTLIFGALMALVLAGVGQASGLTKSTLVWGGIVYALATGLLIHFGLANIGKLESLGLTDSLSGVPNRRALHIDAARFGGNSQEMALALIDLDGFKLVNDHYGHFVGDRVIKECASLLKEMCGKDARFYRLGGDEFAIL